MHTFLIAAISEDGFIAEDYGQISTVWTSKADKQFFSRRTKEAGVIVMGRKTFETVGRVLPGRISIVLSRQSLGFGAERRDLVEEISNFKFQISNLPTEGIVYVSNLSPTELVQLLAKSGCRELAVCGGASVYRQFDEADLLETLYLTIHPVKFGSGISLFGGENFDLSDLDKKYKMVEEKKLDEEGTRLEIFRRQ